MIIKGYIFTYLYLGLILICTNILSKKIDKIITRKITHILVTFTFLIMYHYFKFNIHMIIPPITFIILNYISYKKNIFKGIENKESLGTIYYPISVLIMAILTYFNNNLIAAYAIGLFIMGIGDGLAPLTSKKFKSRVLFNNKTLVGTITVFISSLIILFIFNSYFMLDMSLIKLLIIGVNAMIIELISTKGYDNLFLPLGVFLIVILLGVN